MSACMSLDCACCKDLNNEIANGAEYVDALRIKNNELESSLAAERKKVAIAVKELERVYHILDDQCCEEQSIRGVVKEALSRIKGAQ